MRAFALALLGACSFEPGIASNPDANADADIGVVDSDSGSGMATQRCAKTITVGIVAGSHTNFPLWVLLDDSDIGTRARADGTDIFFTTTTGTTRWSSRSSWAATSRSR